MKKLLFILMPLLLIASLFAEKRPIPDDFLQSVPPEDMNWTPTSRQILEIFFRALLTDSEGGYVLYSKKPVCFYTFSTDSQEMPGSANHAMGTYLCEGAKVWEKLLASQSSINNGNYILHIGNYWKKSPKKWRQILFINRHAFLDVVNKNISIFQYVLGPSVSAEKLLKRLLDPEENLASVVKHDNVLIGILLGFGTQNALYGSRIDSLYESAFAAPNPLYLPAEPLNTLDKKILLSMEYTPDDREYFSHRDPNPSFGYSSLHEECIELAKALKESSPYLINYFPRFFYVGLKKSPVNANLIECLEQAQLDIITQLESDTFLENILYKLGISPNNSLLDDREVSNDDLIEVMIWDIFRRYSNKGLKDLDEFFKGMEEAALSLHTPASPIHFLSQLSSSCKVVSAISSSSEECKEKHFLSFDHRMCDPSSNHNFIQRNEHELPSNPMELNSIYQETLAEVATTRKLLELQEEYREVDAFFQRLYEQSSDKISTPNDQNFRKLWCRIIETGTGQAVNYSHRSVLVDCCIVVEDNHGHIIYSNSDMGKPRWVDVSQVIPGFALGIIGMRIGEKREIFIHPDLAHGIFSTFGKGAILKVNVKLLDVLPEIASFKINEDLEKSEEKDGLRIPASSSAKVISLLQAPKLDLLRQAEEDRKFLDAASHLEYTKLLKKLALFEGAVIWNHYQYFGGPYALKQIQEAIIERVKQSEFALDTGSEEQKELLQSRLNWRIYRNKLRAQVQAARKQFQKGVLDGSLREICVGYLYYQSTTEGKGNPVAIDDSILIHYKIKDLFGNILKDTFNCKTPELLHIKRTIRGFKKGLIGLKEGEHGTLYIHPEWGFRDCHHHNGADKFLIIEFQVVKKL